MSSSRASKIRVGLVQIAELNWVHRKTERFQVYYGIPIPKPSLGPEPSTAFCYAPYSVGLLQAYVQKYAQDPSRYEFLLPVYRRIPIAKAVEQLEPADVVGFSAYVWNIRLSLEMARSLKEKRPDTLVIFGGPQVPDHAEAFLREHPFIDIVCHGEGEGVFLQILEHEGDRDFSSIPSVSYLEKGTFVHRAKAPRTMDLSVIPSPYLTGVFDELMRQNPEQKWLVMWETNRGCPFACTFCDWGSAVASKVGRFDMDRLKAEMEWFAEHEIAHLFVCDANFGMLPRDVEIAKYLVECYERRKAVVALSIQNTKNQTERSYEIQKIFARSKAATFGATLSLQTVSDRALEYVKRDNISLKMFRELQRRFTRDEIDTYTDLIIGMPGETYDSFADGIAQVMTDGQHNRLAFYNCSILPNAEMGDPAYQRKYGMEFVPVRIVHEHESLDNTDRDESPEYLDTVIATASMPREEWVRTRVFVGMSELLHYNRVLQLAFVLLHQVCGLPYRDLVETMIAADPERFPILAEMCQVFADKARDIQAGNPEYVPSKEWLNLWWPVDQYALVKLVAEDKLARMYDEAETVLSEMLKARSIDAPPGFLHEALGLNRLMMRVPDQLSDAEMEASFNLMDVYWGVLSGKAVPLEKKPVRYVVDRTTTAWLSLEAWCSDVVMQLYKRSAYFYDVSVAAQPETAAARPELREDAAP